MTKYKYPYDSETAKRSALGKLNGGEQRIAKVQKMIREIEKELKNARLDFVFTRRVIYGAGTGKTGGQKN